jgi:hypothetical protein
MNFFFQLIGCTSAEERKAAFFAAQIQHADKFNSYSNVLFAALNGRKRAVQMKVNESTIGAVSAQLHFAGSQTLYQGNLDEEEAAAMSRKRRPVEQNNVRDIFLNVDRGVKHGKHPVSCVRLP